MKRFLILLCCLLLLAPSATASDSYIVLLPGLYEVGQEKDIPTGEYDIRFNNLDKTVSVSFSDTLTDGVLDMSSQYSFQFTFTSKQNWWNIGGFQVRLFSGYLLIEDSPIRLWIED